MYFEIGSSRESLPSSISISTAVAVIGLDMDAIQKIESTRMKDLCSGSAQPCAYIRSTVSCVATTVTAPATSLVTITSCMRAGMESRLAVVWASAKERGRKITDKKTARRRIRMRSEEHTSELQA